MFFVILVDDVYCVAIHDLSPVLTALFFIELGGFNSQHKVVAVSQHTGCCRQSTQGCCRQSTQSLLEVVAVSQHRAEDAQSTFRLRVLITMVSSAVFCVFETLVLPCSLGN